MIVRFSLKNILSFGNECEINFLPYGRLRSQRNHISGGDHVLPLLRFSALYGANGAGKSNLLKAVDLLLAMVGSGKVDLRRFRNLLLMSNEPQELAIEVAPKGKGCTYYYHLSAQDDVVIEEELTKRSIRKDGTPSSAGDEVIFERQQSSAGYTYTMPSLDGIDGADIYKSDILPSIVAKNQCALSRLSEIDKKEFSEIREVRDWLISHILVISPDTSNLGWLFLFKSSDYQKFCNEMIARLDTGISGIEVKTTPVSKTDNPQLYSEVKKGLDKQEYFLLPAENSLPKVFAHGLDGEPIALDVQTSHIKADGKSLQVFDFNSESDGTVRLTDILVLMYGIVNTDLVFLVDEIERSIHPLAIKELLSDLMSTAEVSGQLLFTTHNPILLSTDMLRRDEVWFVEKRGANASLYSLSDYYQEHKSIDIAKGYMQGRYGAIPLMGQLSNVKWK
jgi:predicted ATP-dependent endonuclease of OLD family